MEESLHALRPLLASAAQVVYDAWLPRNGQGCCDKITDALTAVARAAGLATVKMQYDLGTMGAIHMCLLVFDPEDKNSAVWRLEIPFEKFERVSDTCTGWERVPDVHFAPEDVLARPVTDSRLDEGFRNMLHQNWRIL